MFSIVFNVFRATDGSLGGKPIESSKFTLNTLSCSDKQLGQRPKCTSLATSVTTMVM